MLKYPSNFSHGGNTTAFIYSLEEGIFQAVFLGIIAVLGVAGNLYICSVVYKNKNLRNPTFLFLVNLAIANIGALTLCTPFPLINSIRRRFTLERHWCLINGFLNNFFFCISIFTLSLIATQNYFTVCEATILRMAADYAQKSQVPSTGSVEPLFGVFVVITRSFRKLELHRI
ncbi:hypothetical protein OS493_016282 [Desmophyllum pertusum]|uniref:G-protein coupled receptors family 1 profile domain-containing protein n=1 Tax=Desmophyllum pertusum TaxID=174260 RepID=A0A9X0A5G9_9CNID|nr:hypothetical protein OS493_016282 [Desmophyllum pertusum]